MQTKYNIELVNNNGLLITCNEEPNPYARQIMPCDNPKVVKDKKDFPFKLENYIFMQVSYKDEFFNLYFDKGFKWNGASIPRFFWRIIGSNADPEFLLPSMVHDYLCNNREKINNNRYLSSLIFKELLIACKVNKFKANLMFKSVDLYQKTQNW